MPNNLSPEFLSLCAVMIVNIIVVAFYGGRVVESIAGLRADRGKCMEELEKTNERIDKHTTTLETHGERLAVVEARCKLHQQIEAHMGGKR